MIIYLLVTNLHSDSWLWRKRQMPLNYSVFDAAVDDMSSLLSQTINMNTFDDFEVSICYQRDLPSMIFESEASFIRNKKTFRLPSIRFDVSMRLRVLEVYELERRAKILLAESVLSASKSLKLDACNIRNYRTPLGKYRFKFDHSAREPDIATELTIRFTISAYGTDIELAQIESFVGNMNKKTDFLSELNVEKYFNEVLFFIKKTDVQVALEIIRDSLSIDAFENKIVIEDEDSNVIYCAE